MARALPDPVGGARLMPSYVWARQAITAGLDHVLWKETASGFAITGTEIAVDDDGRWLVQFSVELDRQWRTRDVRIEAVVGDHQRTLELTADGDGGWTVDGRPAPALGGCLDVDIAATPFTNTFVIRRLGLDAGAGADVRTAWIAVPELDVEALRQTYTRLEPVGGLDRYEYRDERFGTWVLTVDADGVPVDYRGFARRISG